MHTMAGLFDVHTHRHYEEEGVTAIRNLMSDFDKIPVEGWYSVGLHPWYLQPEQESVFPGSLIRAALVENVLAIGECGLDRRCSTPITLQRSLFIRQIELANTVGKPLIIHCVRAFDETLSILRKHRVCVPVIFHGFRQSELLAAQIIGEGHFLSFGRHLMMDSVAEVFRKLPLDRVFLETDDSDIPLADIYTAAAAIRGVESDSLSDEIGSQFKRIFRPVTDLI